VAYLGYTTHTVAYLGYGRFGMCHVRHFDQGVKIAGQKLKFLYTVF